MDPIDDTEAAEDGAPENPVTNEDGSVTFTLGTPVVLKTTVSGKEKVGTLEKVTIRVPLGKHLRALDTQKGEVGKLMALVAACGGLNQLQVDNMTAADLVTLGGIASGFLPDGLLTGAMS